MVDLESSSIRLILRLAGFPNGVETYGLVAGLWMSMFALGNCVGPSAAGLLVDAFDFRIGSLFVIALQLIVVSIIIIVSELQQYRHLILILLILNLYFFFQAGTSLVFILQDRRNGNNELSKDSDLEIHAGNGVASMRAC